MPAKILALEEMLAQHLIIGQLAQILPGRDEIFLLQTPVINTDHGALNTERNEFVNCSGQPYSLPVNISAVFFVSGARQARGKRCLGRVA